MVEKLKDFFFDISDTLFSLLIILIMVFAISWKLSGAMSIPIFKDINNEISAAKPQPKISIEEETPSNDIKASAEDISKESNLEKTNSEETASSHNSIKISEVPIVDIKVEIPRGTTGSGIAKILKEQGLIDSTSQFISRVEELNLSPKLRFGTFTIKSNSSLDQVIAIITGS